MESIRKNSLKKRRIISSLVESDLWGMFGADLPPPHHPGELDYKAAYQIPCHMDSRLSGCGMLQWVSPFWRSWEHFTLSPEMEQLCLLSCLPVSLVCNEVFLSVWSEGRLSCHEGHLTQKNSLMSRTVCRNLTPGSNLAFPVLLSFCLIFFVYLSWI